ncbi:hypothetical protein BDF20DRAFT_910722 [Mycotypha africana]|uniref:uncharacterized protein n=1 Tax=Mycotypha africana TaxID=64632 RepID=UPI0023017BA6|nr:uncharacterized protein BDF20DRAFT_910722 [Mycotypha africana]KAI8988200.1 hypothetical protein BDF20DRAFT_910722 [Mycotypha africana]
MALSEEEANAKLERLQQQVTLNLQAIDKNFAECNQVLTSRTIPEIERYSEATHQIWNHCKSMDREENQYPFSVLSGEDGTNRPAHDAISDRFSRMSHDVTMRDITEVSAHNRLRKNLRRAQSNTTTSQARKDTLNPDILDSESSTYSSRQSTTRSPPRIIPYAMAPDVLQRTPVREAADLFTKDQFRNAGASTSSDDDSNQYRFSGESDGGGIDDSKSKDKGKGKMTADGFATPGLGPRHWGQLNVMEDDVSNRRIFENFMFDRKRNQDKIESRITYNSGNAGMHSPSDRNYQFKKPPESIRLTNTRESFVPEPFTFTPSDAGSRTQTPIKYSNLTSKSQQNQKYPSYYPSPFGNIPHSQNDRQQTPVRTPSIRGDDHASEQKQTPSSIRGKLLDTFNDMSSIESFGMEGSGLRLDHSQTIHSPTPTGFDFAQRMSTLKSQNTPSQQSQSGSKANLAAVDKQQENINIEEEFTDPLRNVLTDNEMSHQLDDGNDTPKSTATDRYARYKVRNSDSLKSADLTSRSSTTANMTMISGLTGQIPARFDLKYFPDQFKQPPASTQLTRIYNYFADRPAQMLTAEDYLKHVNNEYDKETVHVLINLLARKKFLKRVGDRERGAWTIRR